MTLPRTERLRTIQEVDKEWQRIYGGRDDLDEEIANYEMIIEGAVNAEIEWETFKIKQKT